MCVPESGRDKKVRDLWVATAQGAHGAPTMAMGWRRFDKMMLGYLGLGYLQWLIAPSPPAVRIGDWTNHQGWPPTFRVKVTYYFSQITSNNNWRLKLRIFRAFEILLGIGGDPICRATELWMFTLRVCVSGRGRYVPLSIAEEMGDVHIWIMYDNVFSHAKIIDSEWLWKRWEGYSTTSLF